MKKLLTMLLTLSVVIMSCQRRPAPETSSGDAAAPTSSEPITVTALNYFDMTSANAVDGIAQIWDKFSADNPDIKVVREDLFNDPFHNKVEAYAASGNLPDVIYAWPSGRSTTLYTNRLVKDLLPLIQKDGLTSVYRPLVLDPNQFAGNPPFVGELAQGLTSSHAFYVNLAVLEDCGLQPAKTYDELVAQVPILRDKGYETVLMANMDTWVMQSCLFSLIAGRFGGADWATKILDGQAKFTDKDFVDALNFVKRIYDDGVISRGSLTTGYGDVPGLFGSRKGAYLIDGDWRVGAFVTDKSTGQAVISPADQEKILITVFPDIPGARLNKSTSGILGTGWAISANVPAGSAKEEAAWRLVKWLLGKEVLEYQVSVGAVPAPSRTDLDTSGIPLEPMQRTIMNLANEYTTSTPVIDGVFAGSVYTPLNDGLQAIGMGSQTPEQVAKATQDAFDAWKAEGN